MNGSCTGSPDKFSLYIAACIPVIVWDQSAMARIVKDKKIGLTVSSLCDMEKVIASVSNEQYLKMLTALQELKNKLISGQQLKRFLISITTEDVPN